MTEHPDRTAALARAVHETEQHVATGGWDAPLRVFALVDAAAALAADPSLAGVWEVRDDPHHLIAVEQEGLPQAETVEDLLAQLAWPDTVDGVAIVVERVVLPPQVEEELAGLDEQAVMARLDGHPQAQDVRIAAGALRTGETWAALRARSHDSDENVAGARDAVPGLTDALRATLEAQA